MKRMPGYTRSIVTMFLATCAALVAGAILLVISGVHPMLAYVEMINGAVGSGYALSQTLMRAVPLMIIATGLIAVFRANIWNIGAEGQLLMGALLSGIMALKLPIESSFVLITLSLIGGIVGGALWAVGVGHLRAKWNVHEVITSLLLNFVALYAFSYAIRRPLRDPFGIYPQSPDVPRHAELPIVPGLDVHIGLPIALGLVFVMAYVLSQSPLGVRIRMMGASPSVAKAMGANPNRLYVVLMCASGGLAGLAGAVQLLGVQFNLQSAFSPGFGFTAIIVALLGRLNPFGVILASFVIAGISVGGTTLQIEMGLPTSVVSVIGALLVVLLLVADRLATKEED